MLDPEELLSVPASTAVLPNDKMLQAGVLSPLPVASALNVVVLPTATDAGWGETATAGASGLLVTVVPPPHPMSRAQAATATKARVLGDVLMGGRLLPRGDKRRELWKAHPSILSLATAAAAGVEEAGKGEPAEHNKHGQGEVEVLWGDAGGMQVGAMFPRVHGGGDGE